MGLLDFFSKPLERALDITDQFVQDKDRREELRSLLEQMKEETYRAELEVKTVPWVDALHKMGRQLLSWGSLVGGCAILYLRPEIDPFSVAAVVAPGSVYNYVKGKGK